MTWEGWFTLAIVAAAVYILARNLLAPVLAVLFANIILLVAGVITTEQALGGFSNPAPITVGALFIVARAVERTGMLQPIISRTLGGEGGRGGLMKLLFPVAGASAFLNNTPIVAMLTPQVADWAEKRGLAPSRFLMPISFATILGGTITLIGTSTNLVVAGLMEAHGMPPIGMFELSLVGVPIALLGVLAITAFAPHVLPDRRAAREQFEQERREYVIQQQVAVNGPLDGITVDAAGLRQLQGVFLAEVERAGQVIAPAQPTLVLRGGDRLTFVGRVDMVRDLHMIRGLVSAEQEHTDGLNGSEHTFFEVVVSGASSLVGKTLKETGFRARFQAAVLAIHRAGERVRAKLGTVELREGDTLLVLADRGFRDRWRDSNEFLLISHLGGAPPPSTGQAWLAGGVTAAVVFLAGTGILPILQASILGAIALVLSGVLSLNEAKGAVDLNTLVLIGASFGVGDAIRESGLAAGLGDLVVGSLGSFGPAGVLLGVILATLMLTELITNNAAAVMIFPIALAAAAEIGADPRAFAIAVTVAASASFLTPIGYQTNTMVYGPGGYRFTDYARLGAPLTLVVIATLMLIVPRFWPF